MIFHKFILTFVNSRFCIPIRFVGGVWRKCFADSTWKQLWFFGLWSFEAWFSYLFNIQIQPCRYKDGSFKVNIKSVKGPNFLQNESSQSSQNLSPERLRQTKCLQRQNLKLHHKPFGSWQCGKISVLVNYIIQKL